MNGTMSLNVYAPIKILCRMDTAEEKSMNKRKRQRNKGRDRDLKEGTKEIIISPVMLTQWSLMTEIVLNLTNLIL